MKIKNIFVGLMLITLTFTSCNSWFDVSSSTIVKEKDMFKNEQGFKDVLTGVYSLMTTRVLYGRDLSYGYNDVRARYWNIWSSNHNYYKALNNDYKDKIEEARISTLWNTLYKGISNVNAVIANVDNDKSIFAPKMHAFIKGEAYALRAMLHFEVLRLFGVSPSVPSAMQTKSIPYYETFTNVAQPLLTMDEVINKIRGDIKISRDLTYDIDAYGPNFDDYTVDEVKEMNRGIKMNYWATTALLARVELYAGNKVAALAAAKEIIGEPDTDPKSPFGINKENNEDNKLFDTELIFELEIKTLEDIKESYIPEDIDDVDDNSLLMMREDTANEIYEIKNPGDAEYRKTLWIKSLDTHNSVLAKFDEEIIIPMFRLSELYYIAAESSEGSTVAYDYLNYARAGRGLAPVDADIENVIKSEYAAEFIGEGQLFYFYKRKGLTNIGFNNEKNIALSEYVLPLPNTEVEFGRVE